MGKYVLAYTGGGMAEDPAEVQAEMEAWGAWFATMGDQLVDGGNPFGPSTTVDSAGSAEGGRSSLTGYSIINAADLDAATAVAAGCPAIARGGAVEVYETFDVG